MGNDSAKAGWNQDPSDLSKDSLLLFALPAVGQVIDRVVSAKDFPPSWYLLRFLLSLIFVVPAPTLSPKGELELSTRSAYTESRVDNRDKIRWRLSHP